MDNVRVRNITQADDRTLAIEWTDGKNQTFDVVTLRRQCPCASCVDEFTHKRLLKDNDIPETVRPRSIESVGRYALKVDFSDGHSTGIYTFAKLRTMDSH